MSAVDSGAEIINSLSLSLSPNRNGEVEGKTEPNKIRIIYSVLICMQRLIIKYIISSTFDSSIRDESAAQLLPRNGNTGRE